jgi:hypothetical protein
LWVGKLAKSAEDEVIGVVRSQIPLEQGALPGAKGGITSKAAILTDLKKRGIRRSTQVLDVHERGDHPVADGIIAMPLLEVAVRAPYELRRDDLQVVDCSTLVQEECDAAVEQLTKLGFRASAFGRGAFRDGCAIGKVVEVQ